ncbi:hypothetical protein O6H91_05G083500 [Diphasiastrum complanatum]|uniref:Uncharacterized protein n=1 Tax=Diphasiastrum complanatum TaxID=34168 RepID=A0ACC2DQM8_DIPCM|nr:hypothetical protein O6H91_05G083500 [Diphasiastrum complanatum]
MDWSCGCLHTISSSSSASSSFLHLPVATASPALPSSSAADACGGPSLAPSGIGPDHHTSKSMQVTRNCGSREYMQEYKKEVAQTIWPFWKKKKGSSYELRALTRRILVLTKRRQLNQIFELVTNAKKENWKINRVTLNAVLEACVHCLDLDRAFQLYKHMLQPGGCGVDGVTYGILLKGLGEARRLDEAFELLESIDTGTAPGKPQLTAVHLNTLVNACADAGEALRARGVLIRYRPLVNSIGPSIFTYNLLIKGYSRSGSPLEALKVREEMHMYGIQPERLTFNSLILACVRGGDMDRAIQLMKEMKEEAHKLNSSKLLPDVVTYTTLIKGLAESGNIQSLLSMVDEMKNATNFVLDRIAYTSIIDALIIAGSPIEALTYLEELEKLAEQNRQLRPRAHAFLALMRVFAEKGDVEKVADLKHRMSTNAGGNISSENRQEANELLIEAAVAAKQIRLAEDVLRHLVGLKSGCHLSIRGCLAVIRLQALSKFEDNIFSPYILPKEINARLSDIMRAPPPTISSSASVEKALSLLLEAKVDLLVVVSANSSYYGSQPVNEQAVGFFRKDAVLHPLSV